MSYHLLFVEHSVNTFSYSNVVRFCVPVAINMSFQSGDLGAQGLVLLQQFEDALALGIPIHHGLVARIAFQHIWVNC